MTEEQNPFSSPDADQRNHYAPSKDQSVNHEPHLADEEFVSTAPDSVGSFLTPDNGAISDGSVWDEPAMASLAANQPFDAASYRRKLENHIAQTSPTAAWANTLIVSTLAGLLAALITWTFALHRFPSLLVLCMFRAFLVELAKVTAPALLIEFRPYWVKSKVQLLVALGFVPALSYSLFDLVFHWNAPYSWHIGLGWTLYLGVNVLCSLGSCLGLIEVWHTTMRDFVRPQISLASMYIGLAIVIHGLCLWLCS